jgi:hypothetical protein
VGTIRGILAQQRTTRRQTVLRGQMDTASGTNYPGVQGNALSAGSGLALTLTASGGTPYRVSFAEGNFDYVGEFVANQTISGLPSSSGGLAFVERDRVTGALSTGFTTLTPVYQYSAPASPATNQCWFDLTSFTMLRWTGSAWTTIQRVFIGEFTTGASTVTGVRNYAYNGIYDSGWFAVAASSSYTLDHNLGMFLPEALASVSVYQNTTATNTSAIVGSVVYDVGGPSNSYFWQPSSRTVAVLNTGLRPLFNGSAWVTSGFYRLNITRFW